jgi:hypothetical protein
MNKNWKLFLIRLFVIAAIFFIINTDGDLRATLFKTTSIIMVFFIYEQIKNRIEYNAKKGETP